jgi:peptidoglycan/xylan/chitin deacetylase (PgdA/CDA1 family)
LIITIDDGYEDIFHHAYPVLRESELPATVFLTTDKIGNNSKPFWWDRAYHYFKILEGNVSGGVGADVDGEIHRLISLFKDDKSTFFSILNKYETEVTEMLLDTIKKEFNFSDDRLCIENKMLTWEQVCKMRGGIEFGSHTCNHSNLIKLGKRKIPYEILDSCIKIENKTENKVTAFSYPAGNVSQDIKKIVKNTGYEFAVITRPGINNVKDPYELRRINVWDGTSLSLTGSFSKGFFAYKLLGFN